MYKDKSSYGLIFITGKLYSFYIVDINGEHMSYRKLTGNEVQLPNKHNKGGQSAQRFGRLYEERKMAYIKKVSQLIANIYMTNNNTEYLIDKLYVAGSGNKKILLSESETVKKYFSNKIHIINTGNINQSTITDTINYCNELFKDNNINKESTIVDKIKNMMVTDIDKLVFGIEEINYSLQNNELESIITTEDVKQYLDLKLLENNCKCKLKILSENMIKEIGIDIIGIKFYTI